MICDFLLPEVLFMYITIKPQINRFARKLLLATESFRKKEVIKKIPPPFVISMAAN